VADRFTTGNERFTLTVSRREASPPLLESLTLAALPQVNWAVPGEALSPLVVVHGIAHSVQGGTLRATGLTADEPGREIRAHYEGPDGLRVTQHLRASRDKPVWRSWVTLSNAGTAPIGGITRFDAVHLAFSSAAVCPQAGYVLGWLEGPRIDAPGRPPLPWKYGGWIPKFLYGKDAILPPPPEGGWIAPVYRFVQERLTRLPLRSGKRSTYDDQPWVTVLDPERGGGWLLGFEWSGTWRIDVEHDSPGRRVGVSACTDANTHVLSPGQSLVSPAAFLGLFAGDWDDACNVSRWYVGEEIIPASRKPWPTSLHDYYFFSFPDKRTEEFLNREMEAVRDVGFESSYLETIWWREGADPGDFSVGLGDFRDSRVKFPRGLRAQADYFHELGVNIGLWFEIERVDIRTANRFRHPWKPEWIVHQDGVPYRSWGQHFYLLCLGTTGAQEWAVDNLCWAIREYDLDYIMFDSNEWGVCNDPRHDHGAGDGEWAQIQGYYRVMEGVRSAHPDLMIMNSSGGSQRGDFGIARYSHCIHPHDQMVPSSKQRRFMHGTGCMYPTTFQASCLVDYPDTPTAEGYVEGVTQRRPPDQPITAERFEWRMLNRLLGFFDTGLQISALTDEQRAIMRKSLAWYRRFRRCMYGDRFVPAGPTVQYAPVYEETDAWEVYQYVARERDLSVVYFYRCLSPEDSFSARLRGLEPGSMYSVESYRGAPTLEVVGAELLERGLSCRLPSTRCAEIFILTRVS
jgi:alpha-galactosidase